MSKAIDTVSTAPPGHGPAIAVFRPPRSERVQMAAGTIVLYGVIEAVYAFAAPRMWWIFLLVLAPFPAITLWVGAGDVIAAGQDWLKASGGRWVDTGRLTEARPDFSGSKPKLVLRDAEGRKLDVDRALLLRSPQVWAAFAGGLRQSRANGLTLDPGLALLLDHWHPGEAAGPRLPAAPTPPKLSRLVALAESASP